MNYPISITAFCKIIGGFFWPLPVTPSIWAAFIGAVLFSLAVITNPFCLVSGDQITRCQFDWVYIKEPYPGKGIALQIAGTSLFYSISMLVLGLSGVFEPARARIGKKGVRSASVASFISYIIILYGLYFDMISENDRIVDLALIIFAILLSLLPWVMILWPLGRIIYYSNIFNPIIVIHLKYYPTIIYFSLRLRPIKIPSTYIHSNQYQNKHVGDLSYKISEYLVPRQCNHTGCPNQLRENRNVEIYPDHYRQPYSHNDLQQ